MECLLKPALLRLAPVVFAACVSPALAVATVYTSSAAFLPNLAPGAYTNTFTGPAIPSAAVSYSFSEGGFSYTVAGAGQSPSTWINGSIIGNNYPNLALTVTFTSANVTAIGADFFIMDPAGGFLAEPVTVTLSDGTVEAFSPASLASTYRGFTSSTPIASFTMTAPAGTNRFNAIDNLTVGMAAAVPEPASAMLLASGIAALTLAKRRAER